MENETKITDESLDQTIDNVLNDLKKIVNTKSSEDLLELDLKVKKSLEYIEEKIKIKRRKSEII